MEVMSSIARSRLIKLVRGREPIKLCSIVGRVVGRGGPLARVRILLGIATGPEFLFGHLVACDIVHGLFWGGISRFVRCLPTCLDGGHDIAVGVPDAQLMCQTQSWR